MSNLVYPTLPGLEWGIVRAPIFSTTKRSSVSGRQFRVSNYAYPRYKYTLSYSVLRQGVVQGASFGELQQIVGLFNRVQGDFDSFLFSDPDDSSTTAQTIGLGDGSTRVYQLVRTWGSYTEPVYDVASAPQIYVGGALQALGTHYTLSATGLVTLATAPSSGVSVTWTGTYYRRVVFTQSSLSANKFMANLWDLKRVEFESFAP